MKTEIYQYIFEPKRGFNGQGVPYVTKRRVGLILAQKTGDGIAIGASSLHDLDKFDKETALRIAREKLTLLPYGANFPTRVRKVLPKFIHRAEKYFKK